MSNDTELSLGGGGDKIRDIDKSPGITGKTQVIIIDMGGGGVEDITSTPATQATLAALLAELLLKAKLTDTQPVSAASLPLPTGAALEAGNLSTIAAKDFATAAKQDTGNTSLSSIDGKIPAKGQTVMAASMPVVIASDQPAISITGSISATSAATSSSIAPSYGEAVSNALSQTLSGDLRTYDKSANFEMRSETNDLLRILIREIWSLRMGFMRELRDMPEPSEYDFESESRLN